MASFWSNAAAIAALNARLALLNVGGAGSLKIYDTTGGAAPVDCDASIGSHVLLATLPLTNPAAPTAVDIVGSARATFSAITSDASADATGTAQFARLVSFAGVAVWQGTVGVGTGNVWLVSTTIVAGLPVAVQYCIFTEPEAAA